MMIDGVQENTATVSSVLMIGQSNMAGRGNIADVPPIRDMRCFMLRNGLWQPMREPVNPDRPIFEGRFRSGVSPATSFARDYARHFDAPVGLIPCADAGTTLEQWMPGQLLYDHAVCMTKLAQRTSRLQAILWHQGESDCRSGTVDTYEQRFLTMIRQLRKDLGAEDVPVILGDIHPGVAKATPMVQRPEELNRVFRRIAETLPLCAVVPVDGLTLQSDGLHFDAQSCRTLGSRYFQAYLQIK